MSKAGFFSITNDRLGSTFVILNGPMPGGGSLSRSSSGVLPGTMPAKFVASTFDIVLFGLRQRDRELTRLVVGLDARDVRLGVLALRVLGRALDRVEVRLAAALVRVDPLDDALEVARLNRGAVVVLDALADLELVGLAVRRRSSGSASATPGISSLPSGALGALVGEERRVGEPQRLPGLDRVGSGRVEVVDVGRDGDRDRAALLAARLRRRRSSSPQAASTTGASTSSAHDVKPSARFLMQPPPQGPRVNGS